MNLAQSRLPAVFLLLLGVSLPLSVHAQSYDDGSIGPIYGEDAPAAKSEGGRARLLLERWRARRQANSVGDSEATDEGRTWAGRFLNRSRTAMQRIRQSRQENQQSTEAADAAEPQISFGQPVDPRNLAGREFAGQGLPPINSPRGEGITVELGAPDERPFGQGDLPIGTGVAPELLPPGAALDGAEISADEVPGFNIEINVPTEPDTPPRRSILQRRK